MIRAWVEICHRPLKHLTDMPLTFLLHLNLNSPFTMQSMKRAFPFLLTAARIQSSASWKATDTKFYQIPLKTVVVWPHLRFHIFSWEIVCWKEIQSANSMIIKMMHHIDWWWTSAFLFFWGKKKKEDCKKSVDSFQVWIN